MGRLFELKVDPVTPGGAVEKGDQRRVVVVFEAVARAERVVEGDALPHEVGCGLVLPAELEAIAVAAVSPLHRKHPRVAVVPGPAADEATAGIYTTASVATAVVIHRHTGIDSPPPMARAWKRVVMTLPIASCSSNYP